MATLSHLHTFSSLFTASPKSLPIPSPISIPLQANQPESFLPISKPRSDDSLNQALLALTGDSSTFSPYTPPASPPTQEAYSSVLELCASKKALFQGQQVHAHTLKSSSLFPDGFLATKLLLMYGKCGRVWDAEQLFEEMPHRSIFAWNALLGAYISCGFPSMAVVVYQEMRLLNMVPDASTFASVLKACGALQDLCSGSEIHGYAVKLGFISISFVANALVSMYVKCGEFGSARQLFYHMEEERDVVSWNSIISASLQNGKFSEVLDLFSEMQNAGFEMSSYTAVGVLQACAELLLLGLGMQIHASLCKTKRKFEIHEYSALVVFYARCGIIADSVKVFEKITEKDNVSWNSMLSAYVQNHLNTEAIGFFSRMLNAGIKPDLVSLVSVASASGRLGNLLNGMEVHCYALKHVLDYDLQVGNTIMDMYMKCRCLGYADLVFHKMHIKDCISWTTAVAGYVQNSRYPEALELFRQAQRDGMEVDRMMIGSILQACSGLASFSILKQAHGYAIKHYLLDIALKNTIIDVYGECGKVRHAFNVFEGILFEDKDVICWTSMVNCYVQNGLYSEAISLFKEMVAAKIEPDAVSLVSILAVSAGLSSLVNGKEVHGFITRRNFEIDEAISSSLVSLYAQCGNIENSFKLFDQVRCKDLVLFTTMINACGMHGRGEEAIVLFKKMKDFGLSPDHITFLALLHACSHSGLTTEGKYYLGKMVMEYGLDPWPEHYVCIVDLLGRSGNIEEAFTFIKSMPIEPTAAIWCALLSACQVHSNHKLGNIAAERLLELDPDNPGNYVLISNNFAAMGSWKDVENVRTRMKDRGLVKNPACSWVTVGNEVHTFIARDRSHRESVAIYSKLAEITHELKSAGSYVEDTRFVLHDAPEGEKIKMLHGHSERLAIAFCLIHMPSGTPIRIMKNLRVCGDCHEFTKLVTKLYKREIIVRDGNRFHHFKNGHCSCNDFW